MKLLTEGANSQRKNIILKIEKEAKVQSSTSRSASSLSSDLGNKLILACRRGYLVEANLLIKELGIELTNAIHYEVSLMIVGAF